MTGRGPIPEDLAIGLIVIGAGLLVAAFPGPIATMNETFDAVGSKRSTVEPTRWRVLLTRIVGVCIALAGVYYLVTAYNIGGGL